MEGTYSFTAESERRKSEALIHDKGYFCRICHFLERASSQVFFLGGRGWESNPDRRPPWQAYALTITPPAATQVIKKNMFNCYFKFILLGPVFQCDSSNLSFGKNCEGKYWTENLDDYQQLILDLHNEVRNNLSLGNVLGYKSAARMPILRWDKELAKMAELNVKTCNFEHDKCRSTIEFPYCGQNIYFAQTTFNNYTMVDFIKEAVEMWFLEHRDCDMDVMNSFKVTDPQTGHFTTLMTDRNDRVGCAYLQSALKRRKKKTLFKVIFTCNYPSTNIVDIPTYKPGPAGLLCTEPHHTYKGLCFEDEIIDPNDFIWYFK